MTLFRIDQVVHQFDVHELATEIQPHLHEVILVLFEVIAVFFHLRVHEQVSKILYVSARRSTFKFPSFFYSECRFVFLDDHRAASAPSCLADKFCNAALLYGYLFLLLWRAWLDVAEVPAQRSEFVFFEKVSCL